VAFLANPGALSSNAKYRMQRALSISGLYGKQVMRLAQSVQDPFSAADPPLRESLRRFMIDLAFWMGNVKVVHLIEVGKRWTKDRALRAWLSEHVNLPSYPALFYGVQLEGTFRKSVTRGPGLGNTSNGQRERRQLGGSLGSRMRADTERSLSPHPSQVHK